MRRDKPGLYGENGEWLGAPEPFPELDPSRSISICGVMGTETGGWRWMTQEEFDETRDFRLINRPTQFTNMGFSGCKIMFHPGEHCDGIPMDSRQLDSDPLFFGPPILNYTKAPKP